MKNLLPFIFLLLSFPGFSQLKFVVDGKTDVVSNGKAVIVRTADDAFYPFGKSTDTVLIRNHTFSFTGTLKYPEQYRIVFYNKQDNIGLSEPFFVGAGNHKMTINKASPPHDELEIGFGVTLLNEPANDEYIKKYQPLLKPVYGKVDHYAAAKSKCVAIKDKEKRKGCAIAADAERTIVRKSFDNALLTYIKANPGSPIVSWLLYDAIRLRGYSDELQAVFSQLSGHAPANINIPIKNFLAKQKLKTPGYTFPLKDFMQADAIKTDLKSKYILVDFWFSSCSPCIAQFSQMKNVYSKFNNKGFEIVAISIDGKQAIPAYKKIIKDNNYTWLQLLDLNGVKAKAMDINTYPTSFLLDSHFKIIKRNMDPASLSAFLEDNLL